MQRDGEFGERGAGERWIAVPDEYFADVEEQREGVPVIGVGEPRVVAVVHPLTVRWSAAGW